MRDHALHRPRRPPRRATATASSSATATSKYKLDAPQGQAACCLPTPADAAARFDLGPYVAGHPEHAAHRPTAPRSTGRTSSGRRVVNELRARLREDEPRDAPVGLRHAGRDEPGHPGHQRHRVHHGPAEPQHPGRDRHLGRPGLPAGQPEADPLPGRGHGLVGDGAATRSSAATASSCASPRPSPTPNTRSSISINRNLTNNPQTNSQGSGLATLLLGYTTGGSRGFLLERLRLTNSEHSLFVQDDWKVSDRITVNLGLRYEVFMPDTEEEDRLPNFDPEGLRARLRGRGRHRPRARTRRPSGATSRRASAIAWDVTGDAKNVAARRLRQELLPGARTRPGTCSSQQVPYTISQNYSVGDEPARLHARPGAAARRTRSRPSCR